MKQRDLFIIGAGAIVGYLAYQSISKGVSAAVAAVNPLDRRNIVYSGVNAAGAAVSGDANFSLGSWIYDLTHPNYDPNG